ncbi:glycosidase [Vibrio ishigakensis]|uniref:Glycosidase n=1 Tax=Vibrio ishigakensis TaxID=1481914 RepID=A0A0B8P8V8_9VIBR|nr:glycosidase [Vibrio ishigakensis]
MSTQITPNIQASDVILHAFDWPYLMVAERAEEIAKLGYKTVLVSPPMKSFIHEQGTDWWQRYQPQDYRIIDNQLGDTQDFRDMMTATRDTGLRVYVDVVFNHMANEATSEMTCSIRVKRNWISIRKSQRNTSH